MTDRRELLAFDVGPEGVYLEGHSPAVDELEGAGNWFCFETTTEHQAVCHARRLGFTLEEIRAVKEA